MRESDPGERETTGVTGAVTTSASVVASVTSPRSGVALGEESLVTAVRRLLALDVRTTVRYTSGVPTCTYTLQRRTIYLHPAHRGAIDVLLCELGRNIA